jgi:hypothetical protein
MKFLKSLATRNYISQVRFFDLFYEVSSHIFFPLFGYTPTHPSLSPFSFLSFLSPFLLSPYVITFFLSFSLYEGLGSTHVIDNWGYLDAIASSMLPSPDPMESTLATYKIVRESWESRRGGEKGRGREVITLLLSRFSRVNCWKK